MDFRFDSYGKAKGVVVLTGRLDLLAAADLRARLQQLVAEGKNQLVVDLEAVSFIDSSGLGGLIGGLKAARVAGGDFRIARPSEQVRYVLQVSTLDRVLTPYKSIDEAFAGYR